MNKNDKNDKELNTSVPGSPARGLTDLYLELLKGKGIIYAPSGGEYTSFFKQRKTYADTKGLTDADIEKALRAWFDKDIGSWCGYKLSCFWGDIGKIQVKGTDKGMAALARFIQATGGTSGQP